MDFIHCNQCFTTKSNGYVLGSCFHILCGSCVSKDKTNCSVCKKAVKFIAINGNMGVELKNYFSNPIKVMQDELNKIMKKADFQQMMSDHLIAQLAKEREKKKQMEIFLKKKGHDFEAQKRQLKQATVWIKMAEEQLKKAEDEKQEIKNQMDQMRTRFSDLASRSVSHDNTSVTVPPQFSFMNSGVAGSSVATSSNSSFNMVSPLTSSPARSAHNMFDDFFENQTEPFLFDANAPVPPPPPVSSQRTPKRDASSFSDAFNSMITPSRTQLSNVTFADKTSASLEYYKPRYEDESHRFRRDTSFPSSKTAPPPEQTRRETAYLSERERSFPNSIRDLRRYASQPGVLLTRKSIIPSSYLD